MDKREFNVRGILAGQAPNDAPVTVNILNFNNANSYTLDGANTLTLSAAADYAAKVNVASGSHAINAPLAVPSASRIGMAG